jgi:hypothetical protein
MGKKISRKRNRIRSGGAVAPAPAVAPAVPAVPSNVTFAAKLGAYMLESVPTNRVITYTKKGGFSDDVRQVFGILPFLHLNISEVDFKKSLENGSSENSYLRKLCTGMNLEDSLQAVDFKCEDQIKKGFESLNDGLIYSINNKFESRINGQKHLRTILKYQREQEKETPKIIPTKSIEWAIGFDNKSEVVEKKSWWNFW